MKHLQVIMNKTRGIRNKSSASAETADRGEAKSTIFCRHVSNIRIIIIIIIIITSLM